jgi:uncharacterized protein YbaR (Trm112 family)
MQELKCPNCKHKFVIKNDYESGDCPNCKHAYYYWDHVYDEESNEIYFEGYYWDIKLIATQPMPLQEIVFGSIPIGIEPPLSIYKKKK